MNEDLIQEALKAALEQLVDGRDVVDGDEDDLSMADIARDAMLEIEEIESVRTFDDVGLMTRQSGLVIRCTDGSEFQLTIVQSRQAGSR